MIAEQGAQVELIKDDFVFLISASAHWALGVISVAVRHFLSRTRYRLEAQQDIPSTKGGRTKCDSAALRGTTAGRQLSSHW
jgi:hypothetical protein